MDLPSMPDKVEPDALTTVLDGRRARLRQEVRAQMAETEMRDRSDLSTEEYRRQILEDLHVLAKTGHARLGFAREHGGEGDPGGSVIAHEMLGFGDLSLMVKAGVQWGLFGGAVQLLGTRHHHEQLPARHHRRGPAGLLRDDRDGPRLGRPASAHHRHLRPRRRRVRDHHAG